MTMHSAPSRLRARAGVLSVITALVLALALTAPVAEAKKGSCGRASGCNHYELIHAGSTYKWYPAAIRAEFEGRGSAGVPRGWSYRGTPTTFRTQSGAIFTEQSRGDLVTEWHPSRVRGRWEVRFRSKVGVPRETIGTPYAVRLELVPAGAPARCAPESIVMASYDQRSSRRTATVGVRRPGFRASAPVTAAGPLYDVHQFDPAQNTRQGAWRVWAVEVGRDHISWFLDGHVVRRENRPAALIGKPLHLRISLLSVPGAQMTTAVTQIDWARYWSLKRTTHQKKKVRALRHAPALTRSTTPSC
jgi:hypothetical protein